MSDDDHRSSTPHLVSGAGWDAWGPTEATAASDQETKHPFDAGERGRYERGPLLGRGGMGTVTSAHDRRLHREVALKEVGGGSGSTPAIAERLAQEAWITAQLEHPGIVPIYDAGRTPDGELFYTMRLIRGRSLELAIGEAADLEGRLRLLRHYLDACQAVAYAHSLGFIHRDLKPANIMVGGFGETQVVDWGLARPVDGAERPGPAPTGAAAPPSALPDGHAARTEFGAVVGTPAFMSPEQALGQPADRRSDVWSLGMVLYELVAGRQPWKATTSEGVLAAVQQGAFAPLEEAEPRAPRELLAVVSRALAMAPTDRYDSAKELAADIASFLDGRLVEAHEYTPWDHLKRFARAWRIPIGVATAALFVIGAVSFTSYEQVVDERNRAVSAETETRDALARSDRALGKSLAEQARFALAAGAPAEAEVLAAHALGLVESPAARGIIGTARSLGRPELLWSAAAPDCIETLLGSRGHQLLCRRSSSVALYEIGPEPRLVWEHESQATRMQMGPLAVFVNTGNKIRVLDRETGAFERTLAFGSAGGKLLIGPEIGGQAGGVEFRYAELATGEHFDVALCGGDWIGGSDLAPGLRVATTCLGGDPDHALRWGTLSGTMKGAPTGLDRDVVQLSWSPDARLIAMGTTSGDVALFDTEAGVVGRKTVAPVGPIADLRFSANGRLLIVTGEQGGPAVWDTQTGGWVARLPLSSSGARFVGDTRDIVAADDRLRRWTLPERLSPHVIAAGGEHGLTSAVPNADGTALAVSTGAGQVHVHRVADGGLQTTYLWPDEVVVKRAAFSLDGTLVASVVSTDNLGAVFDTATGTLMQAPLTGPSRRIEVLQGDLALTASYGRYLRSFKMGEVETKSVRVVSSVRDLATNRHRKQVACLMDAPAGVALFDVAHGRLDERHFVSDNAVVAVDLSDDGDQLALAHRDGVRIYSLSEEQTTQRFDFDGQRLLDVAWSPGDRYVAASGVDGTATVWDVESDRRVAVFHGHAKRTPYVEFLPDGSALVTASWDGTVRLWSLAHLNAEPSQLVAEAESTWGTTLDEALAARPQ